MKILHLMAGAETGGAENIFFEDVLALADGGLEQAVVTRPNNDFRLRAMRDKNIRVDTASFANFPRWPTKRVIDRVCKEFNPDIVHCWMGRAGTYAPNYSAVNVGWYGGYYKRSRFARCDYHIGLTKDLIRHLREQGVEEDRAILIHTYAEFEDAAPVDRANLDTPEGAPLFLALARLHWKKGLDVLLKSLVDVPGAYLWIAGDGPLREQLEAQCGELGLGDRVRFLGWRDDRGALLAASDICVFPSRYEPFGTVTVDAWASRTPLIAAAAAGPKAYVKDGENGLLVEIDDVDGLTLAMNRLVNDSDLRDRLIEGGLESYRSQFTKDIFIQDSVAFYKRALQSR